MNSYKLKIKIADFKKKILANHNHWLYEPNNFEVFLNKTLTNIYLIIMLILNTKMLKKIYSDIKSSFSILLNKDSNSSTQKNDHIKNIELEKLEKKLDNHLELYQSSLVENRNLKKEITDLHLKIEKFFENNNQISNVIGHNSNSRVDFYQEENLRLGTELVETKKKFDILKNEIQKYEKQRSDLISKINSVNDALNDTNVLTNVFNNDVAKKIDIKDHNNLRKKSI